MAATADAPLQRREAFLPPRYRGLRRKAMLEKQKMPARFQYPANFVECCSHGWNRAECERTHHRIKAVALEGEFLGGEQVSDDADIACCQTKRRARVDLGVRFDDFDLFDGGGVVREIGAGTETDLENSTMRCVEQGGSVSTYTRVVHRPVDESRQDVSIVPTHDLRALWGEGSGQPI